VNNTLCDGEIKVFNVVEVKVNKIENATEGVLSKINTPDSFLNGSVRLSELVVQGSSHFIKVSSAPNLEKKILLTAG